MENNTPTPVSQLHPHQALMILNRWIELKEWTKEDQDAAYAFKCELILQWVGLGTMHPVKVIQRDTIAIRGMKRQLLNQGADLSLLNTNNNAFYEMVEAWDSAGHYRILQRFAHGEHFYLLAETRQQEIKQEYNQQKELYQQQADKISQFFVDNYTRLADAIIEVAREKEKKRERQKQIIPWLEQGHLSPKQQLIVLNQIIKDPEYFQIFAQELGTEFIAFPPNPDRIQWINPETYVPGEAPDFDAALDWVKTTLGKTIIKPTDIDDAFVEDVVEPALEEEALCTLKEWALDEFESILLGEYSPQQAYESLTYLQLEYEAAIGMRSYWSKGEQKHVSYNQWHENNFCTTGYWIVEFVSNVDPTVCLYLPYDLVKENLDVQALALPHEVAETSWGQKITPEEEQLYPIDDLLSLLGKTREDFPDELGFKSLDLVDYSDYDDDDWEEDV